MLALDQHLFAWINELLSARAIVWLLYGVTWLGNGLVLALLIVPAMAWRDRASLRAHLVPMVVSVAATGALVNVAKIVFGRDRPPVWAALHGLEVHVPFGLPSDKSFPSGHAQTSFGAAVYLSLIYPKAAPLCLTLAALVGLSRIGLGVHFPGDVVVGAAIGSVGSVVGYRWAVRRRERTSETAPT